MTDVILLVEDSRDDVELLKRVLWKAAPAARLHVACDGVDAVRYFERNREEFPLPSLILLDIKMPRMTGIEFLQWLRKEDMTLPTVVLSSSNFPADIREAYRLGADGYVVKPTELEDIRKVGQAIADFLARPGGGIEPFIAKFAVPRPRALRSVETSGIRRPS